MSSFVQPGDGVSQLTAQNAERRWRSVISLLKRDPDREDERGDDADEHPRILRPFHFRYYEPSGWKSA
jgi:hypothetical protein